jgi:hypothetical protein
VIESATYTDGARRVSVSVERTDTWVDYRADILNFPAVVELGGERLYMTFHRGRHGGAEPLNQMVSEDDGDSWREAPSDFPLIVPSPATGHNSLDFTAGVLGYLRDGTIAHIDHNIEEVASRWVDRSSGEFHLVNQVDDPTFRWRRWARSGEPVESFTFKVAGLPWEVASYQSYSSLLELENGDLLTALEATAGPPVELPATESGGEPRYRFTYLTFMVRSTDRGRSWKFVAKLDPTEVKPVYGVGDREVDEGFVEADMAVLPNGHIICVMRTGSYSPMFQSRSADGGETWSTPVSTGWAGVKPRLRVLPNGVLACVSGRGAYGHPQVTQVILSLDGTGTRWEAPFAFHTGPGCSYTSTMLRDGKLHVVYSHSDFTREWGTHGMASQAIKRAVLNVQTEPL